MPEPEHGGDLDAARRRHPQAREPWIDLSTGINPWPYPLTEIPPEAWTRLPGRAEEAKLLEVASRYYGAPGPDHLAAAPGSQALIQWLPRLRPASRVAVLAPTYNEHASSWRAAGHSVLEIASLDEASGADVVILVNPNNPDGAMQERGRLLALAARLASRGGWLVVDEAFADVAQGAGLAPELVPGMILLRSFGKFFGLAGLRLGIAITVPAGAAVLRRALGPWAVSGPALAIAASALADRDWQEETRHRLAAAADRLDGILAGAGLTALGGTSLFRLAAHPDAAAVADRLGDAGILVRRFAAAPTRLRFGLPAGVEQEHRLRMALDTR